MRILILSDRIPPENAGGAEKIAWKLALGLREAGHELHVVATTPVEAFEQVREGLMTYHLHTRLPMRFQAWWGLYNPQVVPHLRRLYEQVQPDVINTHLIHNGFSYHALTLARQMGIPVVFTAHDVMTFAYYRLRHFIDPSFCGVRSPEQYRLPPFYNLRQMRFRYNPLRNWFIRRALLSHSSALVCDSDALRQALEANGLPGFQVVHTGVPTAEFQAAPTQVERLRARYRLHGRRVILFAGRVASDKGGQQLLAALHQLVKRLPDAALLVLSRASLELQGLDNPAYAYMKDQYVISAGWLGGGELAAAYQLADVVVVPSVYLDPFPTINLEAMAAGKPVLATCYGGAPEAVVDGETGFIVNPFDTAQMVDRLERLLTDSALRERMGAAGQARVANHFTLAHQVATMERVFRAVVAG
jgi:glycosyltransferase involved in cell wall biosynthesis